MQKMYGEFMTEYEALGHMSPVTDTADRGLPRCYLPHHGVLKASSTTTKLWVVFNGLQRLASGTSFNAHLLTGPDLLAALPNVLLRWRGHQYVMAADIEKMYRQILVHPNDRDLQRIVWRQSKSEDVREYRLNTVTYGLACAPYLAIRTLRQLADDEGDCLPLATALKTDTYVDDILTGADSLQGALTMQRQLVDLCRAGGFALRKWMANSHELLQTIPTDFRLVEDPRTWKPHTSLSMHSTLGLLWYPESDTFGYRVPENRSDVVTRRTVLSDTRIFDPLGWLSPVVIRAKILVQSTWLTRLDWDAPFLPADAARWRGFRGRVSSPV